MQLTRLLRNTERFAWGNWTLDPTIKVGALGWFNPTDSQFQGAQTSIDVPALVAVSSADWHVEQGDVKQSSVGVKFDVPYKDPTTGTEVTVGVQSTWEFGTKGSLTSSGSAYGVAFVEDPAEVMLDKYDEILKVAKKYNKATGDKIDQGFGMITKVWLTERLREHRLTPGQERVQHHRISRRCRGDGGQRPVRVHEGILQAHLLDRERRAADLSEQGE